jgi:HlyD family secretion protein
VRLSLKLACAGVVLGTTVPVIVANFLHDPEALRFKWKLNAEVPIDVKLAPVRRARVSRTIEAPGRVEADTEVKISAQVVGRIVRLPVKEGDLVKKGELLVQIDRAQYDADVRSAESRVGRLRHSIDMTEQDLIKSRRDLDRNRRMASAIARSELVDSETMYQKECAHLAMSRQELIEAEASLVKLKEDLLHTTITSPVNGIIAQLYAKEGEVVVIGTMNTAGSVIMEVSDPASMVVRARVDENNVPLVRAGQKAVVYFQNAANLNLTGTVKRISPKGVRSDSNPNNPMASASSTSSTTNEVATFETIISLDSAPPAVRLGMSANVEILVEERDRVLSVPAQAVQHRRAKDLPRALAERLEAEAARGPGVKDPARRYFQVVYVEEQGQTHIRPVQTGISDENRVEVLGGVAEGERVIAGPYRAFDKLKEGKPVREAADDTGGEP